MSTFVEGDRLGQDALLRDLRCSTAAGPTTFWTVQHTPAGPASAPPTFNVLQLVASGGDVGSASSSSSSGGVTPRSPAGTYSSPLQTLAENPEEGDEASCSWSYYTSGPAPHHQASGPLVLCCGVPSELGPHAPYGAPAGVSIAAAGLQDTHAGGHPARPSSAALSSPFQSGAMHATPPEDPSPSSSWSPRPLPRSPTRSSAPHAAPLLTTPSAAFLAAPPRRTPLRRASSDVLTTYGGSAGGGGGRHPYAVLCPGGTQAGGTLSPPPPSRLLKSTSARDLATGGDSRVRAGRAARVSETDSRVRGGRSGPDGGAAMSMSRSVSCEYTLSAEGSIFSRSSVSASAMTWQASEGAPSPPAPPAGGGVPPSLQRTSSSASFGSACSDKIKGGVGKMEGRVHGGLLLRVAPQAGKAAPRNVFRPSSSSCSTTQPVPILRSTSVPVSSLSSLLHLYGARDSLPTSALAHLDSALALNSYEQLDLLSSVPLTVPPADRPRAFRVRPSSHRASVGDLLFSAASGSMGDSGYASLASSLAGGGGGFGRDSLNGGFGRDSLGCGSVGWGGSQDNLPMLFAAGSQRSLSTLLEMAELQVQVQRHAAALRSADGSDLGDLLLLSAGVGGGDAGLYARCKSMPTFGGDTGNGGGGGGMSRNMHAPRTASGGGGGGTPPQGFGSFSLPSLPTGGLSGHSLASPNGGGGGQMSGSGCVWSLSASDVAAYPAPPRCSGGGGGGGGTFDLFGLED